MLTKTRFLLSTLLSALALAIVIPFSGPNVRSSKSLPPTGRPEEGVPVSLDALRQGFSTGARHNAGATRIPTQLPGSSTLQPTELQGLAGTEPQGAETAIAKSPNYQKLVALSREYPLGGSHGDRASFFEELEKLYGKRLRAPEAAEALCLAATLAQSAPEKQELIARAARIYAEDCGQPEAAAKACRWLLPYLEDETQRLDLLFVAGKYCFDALEFEAALELYGQVFNSPAADKETMALATLMIGTCKGKIGDSLEALEWFELVYQDYAESSYAGRALCLKGLTLLSMRRYAEAEDALSLFLEKFPRSSEASLAFDALQKLEGLKARDEIVRGDVY